MKSLAFLGLTVLSGLVIAQEQPPLPESDHSTIGYRTAAEALESLRKDPAVVESNLLGWTIFKDEAHHTLWSFAPEDSPAYPAAVKREIVEQNGKLYVRMSVQCEASKKACDQLVRDFQNLNDQMRQAVQSRQAGHEQ